MKKTILLTLLLLFFGISVYAQDPGQLTDKELAGGLFNVGNTKELKTAFKKAEMGKTVNCVIIGSMIAAGSGATDWSSSWVGQVSKRIYKKYPYVNFKAQDYSMYMSDPEQGAMLLPSLMKDDPVDIAFVAYSETTAYSKAAYEGIIRQFLQKNAAVICILPPADPSCVSEQKDLIKYYNVTGVSVTDALGIEPSDNAYAVENGLLNSKNQPTDLFYSYVSQIIINKLIDTNLHGSKKAVMPDPLVSDDYQYTGFVSPGKTRPSINKGFRLRTDPNTWGAYNSYRKMWVANDPESRLDTEFEGTGCSIVIKKRAIQGGYLLVSVDNASPVSVNCSYPDGWDTWNLYNIASGLKPGKHTVTLTVSDDIPQGSSDTYVQVCGILSCGDK